MAINDRKLTVWSQPVTSLADKPEMSAADLKAAFDANSNQIKQAFNGLINDFGLSSTAALLGFATGETVTGDTVQAAIEDVQRQAAAAVAGTIPNGTLGAEKLTPALQEQITTAYLLGKYARHDNLLDNWDLRNPVNQRGQKNYTAVNPDIPHNSIDRFMMQGGELTVNNGYVTYAATAANQGIYQRIEASRLSIGSTYTLSCNINNHIYAQTFVWDGADKVINYADSPYFMALINLYTGVLGVFPFIQYTGAMGVELREVELVLGAVSTLAWRQSADYDEELRKCQRYYYDSAYNNSGMAGTFASKEFYNTSYMMCNVRFPVQMRTVPSVIIKSVIGNLNTVSVWENGQDAVTNCTVNYATLGSNGFNAIISESGEFNIDSTYTFHVVASADL